MLDIRINNDKKYETKNNCNSSNQKLAEVFSNVKGQIQTAKADPNLEVLPLYSRAKPRGIILNLIQYRTSLVSFYKKFQKIMYGVMEPF